MIRSVACDLNGRTSAAPLGLQTLLIGHDPYAKRTLTPPNPLSQKNGSGGGKKKRNSLVAARTGLHRGLGDANSSALNFITYCLS